MARSTRSGPTSPKPEQKKAIGSRALREPEAAFSAHQPWFGQPMPSPDPTRFVVPHPSDYRKYQLVNKHLLQAFPLSRGGNAEPILSLADALGSRGLATTRAIQAAGQIVFHCVGDTGSIRGPFSQSLVADKMVADFTEADPATVPTFFYHLGDVVYSFGEARYYYDQFYEPYREYPAPIFTIPGNHDGLVFNGDRDRTLEAYLRNFCAESPIHTPEAGALMRTAMTEPGVYYTMEAPFVRILGVYSNVLEDPGVISSEGDPSSPIGDEQLRFLTAALTRAKADTAAGNFVGAVLIAVHHPPFTYGGPHSGSPRMLADLDKVSRAADFWPHAVLSGHAHNYQRFTRIVDGTQIPYIVAGSGGHDVTRIAKDRWGALRTPSQITDTLSFENYDDRHYGYLRITVNSKLLKIEFHPAEDGSMEKTPDDRVAVDLATRRLIAV